MIKMNKILMIITIALLVIMACATLTNANYSPDTFKGQIDTDATGANKVKSLGGKIVGIIRVIGTIAAVAMITVIGIKYMVGSAEERAEYKKTMFPYLVGAVLIFAASSLTQVIYSWASTI